MGLAELFLGAENPIAKWSASNQNLLGALSAGLAQGPDFGQGVARALTYAPKAKMLDVQAAEAVKEKERETAENNAFKSWLEKTRPDLAPLMDAGVDQNTLFTQALKPETGATAFSQDATTRQQLADQFGLTGDDRTRYVLTGEMPGGNQSVRASMGQPINMRNRKTGEWGSFAPMSDGTLINQLTQELANADDWIVDPGATASAKTGATVDAKTSAAARAALPGMETSVGIAKKAFDLVRNDTEGRKQWFGQAGALPRGMWVQGGSPMANFQTNASQTLGQAFAQARETLKGGGPITDYEGKAAAEAYSRAEMALKQGDEKAFLLAVDDMEAAINAGYQKLLETAQGDPSGGAIGRAGGGEYTVLGVE